ncbi:Microtubule-associated protein RP/EB family member 1A [Porphyridium purpureum]|uniref:Microtubule-associated protein RP/EB family member 1A n=1 Tax=Porphyridium purpureum TaxID=35688 RepID=A0A5J4YQZ9_PORPP|nr:Microtubule-associated protein RP/EB family member 1A [Porphyridium purpureum]|eukprot:POR5920..scf222_8
MYLQHQRQVQCRGAGFKISNFAGLVFARCGCSAEGDREEAGIVGVPQRALRRKQGLHAAFWSWLERRLSCRGRNFAMDVVGIMEGAYFKPRTELLRWVNATLGLSYKKVEEMSSGSAYCRLFSLMYPESLPLGKVIMAAKRRDECLRNWKLLQAAFNKANISYSIDINRQIEAKAIASLEFMQWFYAVWSRHNVAVDVNEHESFEDVLPQGQEPLRMNRLRSPPPEPEMTKENLTPSATMINRAVRIPPSTKAVGSPSKVAALEQELRQMHLENKKLESRIADFNDLVVDLEKERDYYYNLGLAVEQHCKENVTQRGSSSCHCYHEVLRVMFGDAVELPDNTSEYTEIEAAKTPQEKTVVPQPPKENAIVAQLPLPERTEGQPVDGDTEREEVSCAPEQREDTEEQLQPPELEQTADICLDTLDLPVDPKKLDEMEDYFA